MEASSYFKKVLFTTDDITRKCKELAEWVNREYQKSDDLIIVGLLKGAVPFLAELIKNVRILHRLDFMTVSSFGGTLESSGNLKFIMDLNVDIYNKDVLIVEDIIDTGLTFSKVFANLQARKPKSLKSIALLNKKLNRQNQFKVDRYGFEVPNEFLIGFGLDFKERFRNVPYIGVFDQAKIDKI